MHEVNAALRPLLLQINNYLNYLNSHTYQTETAQLRLHVWQMKNLIWQCIVAAESQTWPVREKYTWHDRKILPNNVCDSPQRTTTHCYVTTFIDDSTLLYYYFSPLQTVCISGEALVQLISVAFESSILLNTIRYICKYTCAGRQFVSV